MITFYLDGDIGYRKTKIKNIIKEVAPNSKVLISANKQDLKEAKSPEEIEGIFHYPAVGFSAIEPNAVKNFEKIVYDFFFSNPKENST